MSKKKKTAKPAPKKNSQPAKSSYTTVIIFAAVILAAAAAFLFFGREKPVESAPALDENKAYYADIVIEEYGKITVLLDQKSAPITAANFVYLADKGFYTGLTFHRIMEGFMMQGGAPKNEADEAPCIVGEFAANGYNNPIKHERGVISMARSKDMNSANSQFFIMHETKEHLDGEYAAFGRVIEGMDVVDAVCESAQPINGNGAIAAKDQPVIRSITIRVEG